MKKRERRRWKPSGSITVLDKDRLGTIFLYTAKGMPAAVCYRGRKTRPEVYITMASQSELEAGVARWLDGLRRQADERKKYRSLREQDEWGRNNVIRRIRSGLARRGLHYSVTGGRGTAWGWIRISLLPSVERLLTPDKRIAAERRMHQDLGIDLRFFSSGWISIPASTAYYREYVDRAEGRTPAKVGKPYWD